MTLSAREIERYAHHLLLKEIGGGGQNRLKEMRILVVGAGGLGAPLLLYLAAAGIGVLGIIDDDRVSLSNLQRQIIHEESDIGHLKTESAARALYALNSEIEVRPYPYRLSGDNIMALLADYDVVADGSDNFATRYLLCDACFFAKKPLISAALGQFDGQLATFRPYETDPKTALPYPSRRCLHPMPDPMPERQDNALSCEEGGILGVVAGVMGTLQGVEVIKESLGIGRSLAGRLLLYNALAPSLTDITVPWDPDNPLTGRKPTIKDLSDHM